MTNNNFQDIKGNIAIISAQWHQTYTDKLAEDCIVTLENAPSGETNNKFTKRNNIQIRHYKVPGSAELPITAQMAIESEFKPDIVICIGVLIKGETHHYEYISQQVSVACQNVAIKNNTPIIFGVLTCTNIKQVQDRIDGTHSKCGEDWANAALSMLNLKQSLKV